MYVILTAAATSTSLCAESQNMYIIYIYYIYINMYVYIYVQILHLFPDFHPSTATPEAWVSERPKTWSPMRSPSPSRWTWCWVSLWLRDPRQEPGRSGDFLGIPVVLGLDDVKYNKNNVVFDDVWYVCPRTTLHEKWWCSIAMLNYQRGVISLWWWDFNVIFD